MRVSMRGMFYLLLVLAFVLLSTLKPAFAAQYFDPTPAIIYIDDSIPLSGLVVCGLQENEGYAHEAAKAVAQGAKGSEKFTGKNGPCTLDFAEYSAVPDNTPIERIGTALVISATIGEDMQGYVIIPLGARQCTILQKLGRPSCKGA